MFEEDDNCHETKSFLKLDVEGADTFIWSKLKENLTILIVELLDSKANVKTGGTVKQESQRIAANILEYANSKLEKASIENQKLFAELEGLLANQAKTHAETRKINAEADAIEIENVAKKLRLAIGLAKAIAPTSSDPNALIFVKNIEELAFIFQEKKIHE
ncbi:hypothetical protein [Mucilaginibacter sp.]|uniref:hypothetical protein n=1 Tax=Mucilaginibacter sp. TaxID=1882438 RepID=UPI0026302E0D|nr:hypothetical protein [Mucilaginibacter sp.]MDB5029764.1 hypothetical protein [Mucilaginibacter sp.]